MHAELMKFWFILYVNIIKELLTCGRCAWEGKKKKKKEPTMICNKRAIFVLKFWTWKLELDEPWWSASLNWWRLRVLLKLREKWQIFFFSSHAIVWCLDFSCYWFLSNGMVFFPLYSLITCHRKAIVSLVASHFLPMVSFDIYLFR